MARKKYRELMPCGLRSTPNGCSLHKASPGIKTGAVNYWKGSVLQPAYHVFIHFRGDLLAEDDQVLRAGQDVLFEGVIRDAS